MTSRRAIAYIDGHNFYHGVAKDCPGLKWLDLQLLCERLLRGYRLLAVNYYTAKVIDFPSDPGQSQRQNTYNRALQSRPLLNVVLGQFQKNEKTVRLTSGAFAKAIIYEEKGSDVNLGTDLSWDACNGEMEAALVISNDFDLQRPIERAMTSGVEVVIVNPHRERERGTRSVVPLAKSRRRPAVKGTDTRKLTKRLLMQCQFPDIVTGRDGAELRRPKGWV
jgi:hypothetical protein